MPKDTHCTADLFRGPRWADAKLTGSFSGTPSGVIRMLFEQLARKDPEEALVVFDLLKETLREIKQTLTEVDSD